jgi:PhzF family phenazine biosynthesis protein
MRLPVDWVDAFTDRPFGGNGCAVVHDGGALDPSTCLDFTRETGLVECTFTGPSDVADARVRFFLPTREIPFAGHPTIATVASLLQRGVVTGDACTLETGAGVLDISIRDGWIEMTQIAPSFGDEQDPAVIAAIFGLSAEDIAAPPQIVSTGLPFCITVLRDAHTLGRAVLNPERLAAWQRGLQGGAGPVIEPYLIAREGASAQGDTFARLLLPPPMPPEDPFTGSATGAAAAYLWARGLIARPDYIAEQGHGLGRPGQARVQVIGPPGAITGVRVAGRAHVLMSGDLLL